MLVLIAGQDMLDICQQTILSTSMSSSTLIIASPGYPNRMSNADLHCSCVIQAVDTEHAYILARYLAWQVDGYSFTCWSLLTLVTRGTPDNPSTFCPSTFMKEPLINRSANALLVYFVREKSVLNRSGFFTLEINFSSGK